MKTKPLSSIVNPLFSGTNPRRNHSETTIEATVESRNHPWSNGDRRAVGLAIVVALCNDRKSCKTDRRMVLFGSQLNKIQIQKPTIDDSSVTPTRLFESHHHSPIEFGVKSNKFRLGLLPLSLIPPTGIASLSWLFTGGLNEREMELSEDYTCVISHGPNPKTTHIFDNCIVEGLPVLQKENGLERDCSGYPWDDFMTFCLACKKNIGQGKDVFIYRGERAFCSDMCRFQEIMVDENTEMNSSNP